MESLLLSKSVLHSSYLLIAGAISHLHGGCEIPVTALQASQLHSAPKAILGGPLS